MDTKGISSIVKVKHCFFCVGDAEYYCHSCKHGLCNDCKTMHTIELATYGHFLTLYRERYKYPLEREECMKHFGQLYEVYCETCQLPICFQCVEHRQHRIEDIRVAYKSEVQRNRKSVHHILSKKIPIASYLLNKLRSKVNSCHKEIFKNKSEMISKSLKLKRIADSLIDFGEHYKRCLIQTLRRHVVKVTNYEQRFEQSAKKPVRFLRFINKCRFPETEDSRHLLQNTYFPLTPKVHIRELIELFNEFKIRNLKFMFSPVFEACLEMHNSNTLKGSMDVREVPGLGNSCDHISSVTGNQIWISNNMGLISAKENKGACRYQLTDLCRVASGSHTVNNQYDIIYINTDFNIIKRTQNMEKVSTLIKRSDSTWTPICVYFCLTTWDLLVGSNRSDIGTGKVERYNSTGKHTQTIMLDRTGCPLYERPLYITENNNGDVLVSDIRAVVVTERRGWFRFSYKGRSPKLGFSPRGICIDALSRVLICDIKTDTIQMIDSDGQFLSYLVIKHPENIKPISLWYEMNANLLFIGLRDNKNLLVYRYEFGHHPSNDEEKSQLKDLESDLRLLREGEDNLCLHVKSPELDDLLNSMIAKLQTAVSPDPHIEFLADEAKSIAKQLEYLRDNILLYKHPYRLNPGGALFALKVDLEYKNGKLWIIEKNAIAVKTFPESDRLPKVILVNSQSMSTIEAKVTVYRKYKDVINMDNTYIHHEYDENSDVAKFIAFYNLSSVYRQFGIDSSFPEELVCEAFDIRARPYDSFIRSYSSYETFSKHDIQFSLNKFTRDLLEDTAQDICMKLEMIFYEMYGHISNWSSGPLNKNLKENVFHTIDVYVLSRIKFHSVTSTLPIKFDELEELKKEAVDAIQMQFSQEKKRIVDSIKEIYDSTDFVGVLERCKRLCKPVNLIEEWEKREHFKATGELKKYPAILKYILGWKNDRPSVKVFLEKDDENARGFFEENGGKHFDQTETQFEFINIEEESEKRLAEIQKLEKSEQDASEIPLSTRKDLKEIVNSEGDKIYSKHSSVVEIGISNILTRNGRIEETPCIVLYCLDKDIIPFGEKPLPKIVRGYPCDIREEIVLFGSCLKCTTVNPGCNIESDYFSGSAGFLVNLKNSDLTDSTGFLTAAHVVAQHVGLIYRNMPHDFVSTLQTGDIKHPLNSLGKVGEVDNCICGNFRSCGSDVAIVRLFPPTQRRGNQLPIAEENKLCFKKTQKVIKRGNETGETTGLLGGEILSVKISPDKEPESPYIFKNLFSAADDESGKPFFKIGDSGSGVFVLDYIDNSLAALGIAFARARYRKITYVCKIKHISDEFNITVYEDMFLNNNTEVLHEKEASERTEEPMDTSEITA